MFKDCFETGDKVQVSWVDHSLQGVTVVWNPGETDDGCWYLRTQTGRLFSQNPNASNFEGLWEPEKAISGDELLKSIGGAQGEA